MKKKISKKPLKKKVVPTRKASRGSSVLKSKIGIKKAAKKAVKKAVKKVEPKKKPIGKVLHFYNKICVAVIKFDKPVKVGAELHFESGKTCFSQPLKSMQYEHQPIQGAKKGQEVGVKVEKEVREGDLVYQG